MNARDIEIIGGGVRMLARFIAKRGAVGLPGVLLLHDAFGLDEECIAHAEALAAEGYAVLAADIWGSRTAPSGPEVGESIGRLVADRDAWLTRIRASHAALAAQSETDSGRIAVLGYCMGGSGALEHLRTGAELCAVVAVHAGLDLLADDWSAARASQVLILTGAVDPMATQDQRTKLQSRLDGSGSSWEINLFSGTPHAFTSKKPVPPGMENTVGYRAESAERSSESALRFLARQTQNEKE